MPTDTQSSVPAITSTSSTTISPSDSAPIKRGIHKTKKQRELAASLIEKGEPIGKALVAAGWSEHAARRGTAAISAPVLALLGKKGAKYRKLGKSALADPRQIEEIAIGRLVSNAIMGKDLGFQSAKQLGSHKAVDCWKTEKQIGIISITIPQSLQDELVSRAKTIEGVIDTIDE